MNWNSGNFVLKRIALIAALLVCASIVAQPVQALSAGSNVSTGDFARLLAIPTNDNMASATAVSLSPDFTDVIPDTTDAALEAGEPSYDCASGVDNTVWYSYMPASDGYFVVDTFDSDYNTVVHVFEGPGIPPSTLVACNNNVGYGQDAEVLIDGDHTKTYLISVGGVSGASGDMHLRIHEPGDFINCAGVTDVPEEQCDAVFDLYNDTGGDSWTTSDGWLEMDEVCLWEGIECYEDGLWGFQIYEINLADHNLTGTWTTDLTPIASLNYLYLSANNLDGDLATVISNLPTGLTRSVWARTISPEPSRRACWDSPTCGGCIWMVMPFLEIFRPQSATYPPPIWVS